MTRKELVFLIGMLVLVGHMLVIIDDVQAVLDDPTVNNKPAEIAKLVVDVSRYWN